MTTKDGTRGEPRRRSGRRSPEPLQHIRVGAPEATGEAEAPRRRPSTRSPAKGRSAGLDRIRPRSDDARDAASARREIAEGSPDERDPLGRAALYSSGAQQQQPALGTFLVECSACRRETPVTAGDLVRLGLPSFHMPLVKRFPSLMRCPACGRRTWVRVRWRL